MHSLVNNISNPPDYQVFFVVCLGKSSKEECASIENLISTPIPYPCRNYPYKYRGRFYPYKYCIIYHTVMPVIRRIPLWQNIPIYHWMKELQYSRCSDRQSPLRQLPEPWTETVPPSQRKSATILSSKRRAVWDMPSMTAQTVSAAHDPICAQSPDAPEKIVPSVPGVTSFVSII